MNVNIQFPTVKYLLPSLHRVDNCNRIEYRLQAYTSKGLEQNDLRMRILRSRAVMFDSSQSKRKLHVYLLVNIYLNVVIY